MRKFTHHADGTPYTVENIPNAADTVSGREQPRDWIRTESSPEAPAAPARFTRRGE
jgi:hypothetical protein